MINGILKKLQQLINNNVQILFDNQIISDSTFSVYLSSLFTSSIISDAANNTGP